MKTYYESELTGPLFESREDADFMIEKIRELAWPVIVVRFEDVAGHEAQARLEEINSELASRGLPTFAPVKRRRRKS